MMHHTPVDTLTMVLSVLFVPLIAVGRSVVLSWRRWRQ